MGALAFLRPDGSLRITLKGEPRVSPCRRAATVPPVLLRECGRPFSEGPAKGRGGEEVAAGDAGVLPPRPDARVPEGCEGRLRVLWGICAGGSGLILAYSPCLGLRAR